MNNPFQPTNRELQDITIRRAPEAISTELDGETVILNIGTGIYSGLDPVGTCIWNRLESQASFRDLTETVCASYEVTTEQCIADLCDFLGDLLKNSLIEVTDGPAL